MCLTVNFVWYLSPWSCRSPRRHPSWSDGSRKIGWNRPARSRTRTKTKTRARTEMRRDWSLRETLCFIWTNLRQGRLTGECRPNFSRGFNLFYPELFLLSGCDAKAEAVSSPARPAAWQKHLVTRWTLTTRKNRRGSLSKSPVDTFLFFNLKGKSFVKLKSSYCM